MTTETGLLTAEDLLRLHSEGVNGELVRGVLHEIRRPVWGHSTYVINLAGGIHQFLKAQPLGFLFGFNTGVWLERDPDTVRAVDLAYTSFARRPRGTGRAGYAEVVPDLVAEFATRAGRTTTERSQMWLSAGAELVWFVFPETRSIDVYRAGEPVVTVSGDGPLDGLDVLPGFSCPLTDIFDE